MGPALLVAVTFDVIRPATLGVLFPGRREEYGLERDAASLVPFAASIGTAVGSLMRGRLGDRTGRRGSILPSFLMFIGASIRGAVPVFGRNAAMCFLLGLSAGAMLPTAIALSSDMVPARRSAPVWPGGDIGFLSGLPGTLDALGMQRDLPALSGILAVACMLIVITLYSRCSSFRTMTLFTIITGVRLFRFAAFAGRVGTPTIIASVPLS